MPNPPSTRGVYARAKEEGCETRVARKEEMESLTFRVRVWEERAQFDET